MSRRLMPLAMLGLIAAIVVGAYLLLWASSGSLPDADVASQKDHLSLTNAPEYGMFIAYQVGFLMTVVLSASSIATEYGWGTVRTILARTGSRPEFLSAKIAALAVFALLISLAGAISVAVGSSLVTVLWGLDTDFGDGFVARAAGAPVRMCVALLPYASLSFLVALWSRTTAAGIVLVVVAFYSEVLLMPLFQAGGALSWFPEDVLIYRNILAVLDANAVVRDPKLPNAWLGAGILATYTAALVGAAMWRFTSRDVTAG